MIKMKMSIAMLLKEYAKLSSAHFAVLSAMIPLMGAVVMGEINFFRLLIVFLIGIFTHSYVFALNHYYDVELDRLNPELAERPLVQGTISKKHALIYIISMFLVALLLTITYLDVVVLLLFLLGILFATLYDLFNKKIYGGDFILAASVTVGCMFGSSTVSLQFTDLTYIIWMLAFIQGLNMNLVGGGFKDAVHDHIKTSKTVAVKLGVTLENRILKIPISFQVIAFVLGIIYAVISLSPFILGIVEFQFWQFLMILILNILYLLVVRMLLASGPYDRNKIRVKIVIHSNINWCIIPVLLMSVTKWAFVLLFLPLIGNMISNFILYRTIIGPKMM
jgi:4-hydroxybenzoate polyprenyltransferase